MAYHRGAAEVRGCPLRKPRERATEYVLPSAEIIVCGRPEGRRNKEEGRRKKEEGEEEGRRKKERRKETLVLDIYTPSHILTYTRIIHSSLNNLLTYLKKDGSTPPSRVRRGRPWKTRLFNPPSTFKGESGRGGENGMREGEREREREREGKGEREF